jgi:hypothetical protein
MISSPDAEGPPERLNTEKTAAAAPLPPPAAAVKTARILDEEEGGFTLEYDNTRGQQNTMRLDALTYEGAIREARSYLGIAEDDQDEDGDRWTVE